MSRIGELLHLALVHDRDARRQRHRLDLVVGDIDDGGADPLVQLLDLHAHLDAQLGVEIGERLVEQEQQRDRAPARGPSRRAGAGRRRAAPGLRSSSGSICSSCATRASASSCSAFGTWRHSMPKVMFWRTVIVG